MLRDPIDSLSVSCPECDTCITFNNLTDIIKMAQLLDLSRFKCPLCNAEISGSLSQRAKAVHNYNMAVKQLEELGFFRLNDSQTL